MKLPTSFDANEWVTLITAIVLISICLLIPKRFPAPLTFVLMLFNSFLGTSVDFILAVDYPFNFYDTFDSAQYDLMDFIMYTLVYSLYGYLFLYFYDWSVARGFSRIPYIALWVAASVMLEGTGERIHIFKYNNWNLVLSTLSYVIIFLMNVGFLLIGKQGMNQIRNASRES